MGTFFIYVLKSAICLIFFYLFYKLLLSRDTFHRFNRVALLSLLAASFIVPFGAIDLNRATQMSPPMVVEHFILQAESASTIPNTPTDNARIWVIALLATYVLGAVCCLLKQSWSTFSMLRLIRQSRTASNERTYILKVHNKPIAPFSWMRFILISEKDLNENGQVIKTHEQAHICKGHSWDLLLADLCILVQWFNPAAWLLKRELQSIHEFEADEMVINQGIDAKQYQLLIIKKAVGTRLYSMANSFNHSSLKKRITMMLKEKSNPWARLKYLYVLPLACVTMMAFARPEVSKMENESKDKINEVSVINAPVVVKNVEKPSLSASEELLAVNEEPVTKAGTAAKTGITIQGKVTNTSNGKALSNVNIVEKDPSSRDISVTTTNDDGTFRLETKNNSNVIRFSCMGYKTTVSPISEVMNIQLEEANMQVNETVVEGSLASAEKKVDAPALCFEQMPQYPGGDAALMEYLRNSLHYPSKAIYNKIEGRVTCSIVIDPEGKVTNIEIIRQLDPEMDNEAIRVLKAMPNWIPGKQNGKPVAVKYTIPITFKLKK